MIKNLIKNFFIDRINIIGLFIFNAAILIVFFNLEEGTRKEVVYPVLLSAFSLLVLLITEWVKFYCFNYSLEKSKKDLHGQLKPVTIEQKEISKVKGALVRKHQEEINEVSNENKNKNYFISQWIHNLKTPISVIDLLVQKCKLEGKDPYEALANISDENKRLHNSVEQILTIIRLEDFEKDYEAQTVNLVQCMKTMLNKRKGQFILSGIFPELKYDSDEVQVITDKKWNELMLDQIISNAIKYSKEEGKSKNVYIDIKVRGDKTILSIKDQGIGIPSYDLDRIFEPFFTGENGRIFQDSTGIGLYISSEIVKRLGHKIEINSELKKGTEVIVEYITKL